MSRSFYHTRSWNKCREAFIKTTNGLCTRCLAKNIIKPGFIVHHRQYINDSNVHDPDITYNFDNLEYLCHSCHNKEHFLNKKTAIKVAKTTKKGKKSRITFDEFGQVVALCQSETTTE